MNGRLDLNNRDAESLRRTGLSCVGRKSYYDGYSVVVTSDPEYKGTTIYCHCDADPEFDGVSLKVLRGCQAGISYQYQYSYYGGKFNYDYHFLYWLGERIGKRHLKTGQRVFKLKVNNDGYLESGPKNRSRERRLTNHFENHGVSPLNRGFQEAATRNRCDFRKKALFTVESDGVIVFVVADGLSKETRDVIFDLVLELRLIKG